MKYNLDSENIQMSGSILDFFSLNLSKTEPIKILEYGSGVSTLWFSETFPNAKIYSLEGDRDWFESEAEWISREELKNIKLKYVKQNNSWDTDPSYNQDYLDAFKDERPFDLILNDGALREMIGEQILENVDEWLVPGGMYLRHDYQKLIDGEWVGYDKNGTKSFDGYERYCDKSHKLIVLHGSHGTWGENEAGGIWRMK